MDFGQLGTMFSSAFTGDNMAKFGNLTSGLGSIYSAYNANKLGNSQIDLMKQQNNLLLSDYKKKQEDKDKINTSFSSVWG